jgi:hypothetical protein
MKAYIDEKRGNNGSYNDMKELIASAGKVYVA